MPRYPDPFIQQVAQATDIVELIRRYLELKPKGREFVGLCPFHDDHTPSLTVSPTKQIFKCFACGAGGGVFQFLTRYEKISFPEAVEALADRAHIPIPEQAEQREQAPGMSKNDLLAVTELAGTFYRGRLRSPAGAAALDYARRRGLTDESIDRFALGYAPDSWDALLRHARAAGVGEGQLVAAGLAVRRERGPGCYDRFRNRLIFPILDPVGRVIAFGGRAMSDDEPAKYLNSPESILFDKSSNLYALSWTRQEIHNTGQAVVVEGYLDALIPMQAGVSNVVATLGTALTDRHVRLLRGHAREVVLVFDADEAGRAAAERALELFLAQQLHVRVATVPAGKDPCDYCLAEGPDALRQLVADAPDAIQYVWNRRLAAYEAAGGNLADRRAVVEDFLRLVATSAAYGAIDEVRRSQLAQHIAHLLNVPSADLQQQMRRLSRRVRAPSRRGAPAPEGAWVREGGQAGGPTYLAERQLLEVLLNRPDLLDSVCERIGSDEFEDPHLRTIARSVWRLAAEEQTSLDDLLACEELAELGGLVTDLAAVGEDRGNYEETLARAVEFILYRRERESLEQIRSSGLDDETLRRLQQSRRSGDVRRRPKIT